MRAILWDTLQIWDFFELAELCKTGRYQGGSKTQFPKPKPDFEVQKLAKGPKTHKIRFRFLGIKNCIRVLGVIFFSWPSNVVNQCSLHKTYTAFRYIQLVWWMPCCIVKIIWAEIRKVKPSRKRSAYSGLKNVLYCLTKHIIHNKVFIFKSNLKLNKSSFELCLT